MESMGDTFWQMSTPKHSSVCRHAPSNRSRANIWQCRHRGQRSLHHFWPIAYSFSSPSRRNPSSRLRAETSEADKSQVRRDPEDVRGAIAVGLSLYEDGKYQEALEVFEKGLELPGTGMKRFRDKPRSISDGEKQSILYNVACCYSRLEDTRTGLVALAGCLESGYDDASQLRRDPDLEFLRRDSRFNGLLERFKLNSKKGFLEQFLKGFNL